MNEEIRVARMAPYSECESLPDFLGGLGGWFKPGMRWADFIATVHDTAKPHAEA